jgi:hypothetical protein
MINGYSIIIVGVIARARKANKINCIWSGVTYGTTEDMAFFYDTDICLAEFHAFKEKIFAIMGGDNIDYGNTSSFLSLKAI